MDQTPPNEPRHLNPITAVMPAIPRTPTHARLDSGEMPVPAIVRPTTRQERREAKAKPWWKKVLGI